MEPPPPGWIKENIVGSFDHVSLDNGAGCIMRDFAGKPSFCATITFEVFSSEEAETRTIWEVLKKEVEQQITHFIDESDAKAPIDKCSPGNFESNQQINALFKDIPLFNFSHVACIFFSSTKNLQQYCSQFGYLSQK